MGETMTNEWGGLTPQEKTRENRLRRQAKRLGLGLKKSRARAIHLDDFGGYRIVGLKYNSVVRGSRFELDLDDVAEYLDETEAEIRREGPSDG